MCRVWYMQVRPEMIVEGAHLRFFFAGAWKPVVVRSVLPDGNVQIGWHEGTSDMAAKRPKHPGGSLLCHVLLDAWPARQASTQLPHHPDCCRTTRAFRQMKRSCSHSPLRDGLRGLDSLLVFGLFRTHAPRRLNTRLSRARAQNPVEATMHSHTYCRIGLR